MKIHKKIAPTVQRIVLIDPIFLILLFYFLRIIILIYKIILFFKNKKPAEAGLFW